MSDPFDEPTQRRPSSLPLVNGIREEVAAWRRGGYLGASDTSRRLLEHWFLDEHQTPDGEPFRYYFAQREAVESLIYLHEVARVHSTGELVGRYADRPVPVSASLYPRYVFKMATGSGKTKVMSLAVAWAYFHALREEKSALSPTSLLVAPNLIVFERLKADFASGKVFHEDPVIPPEWRPDFDLQVVFRHDPVPVSAAGVLCVTNVHVLYERGDAEALNPVERLLGPRPPKSQHAAEPLLQRLARRGRVVVLNDEAHHLHDEIRPDTGQPLQVIQVLRKLHEESDGIAVQLDFSATPRNQQGQPFAEIVVDYPLAEAIEDGIVKRPIIGELSGDIATTLSDDASIRYRQQIDAGVAKWREFRDKLASAGHKPLLFVMAEDTAAADQISRYLQTLPDLAGGVLTLHVNMRGRNKGQITAADLQLARQAAAQVDGMDNPYSAIVSVLMLREGWDVRNVTVIVPLRPYTAKAQILPEQTLGRGLRRMNPPGTAEEQVVVIEHEAFRSFWDQELANEGLSLERMDPAMIQVASEVVTVLPDRIAEYDIAIPQLGRRVSREHRALEDVSVAELRPLELRLAQLAGEDTVHYTGRDLLTQEVVERAEYPLPRARDARAVLAWFANELQRRTRLTGQFSVLLPLVRDYLQDKAFNRRIDLNDPLVLDALAVPASQESVLRVLEDAVNEATLTRHAAEERAEPRMLSSTRPFLWSRDVAVARRSIFGLQPCDSGFEIQLVGFLDSCPDVAAFAKLAPPARVSMEYINADGRLAYYYPDFVVRTVTGEHFLLEAKGRVDLDVPEKDRRATQWAADATAASGVTWAYFRIDEPVFERYGSRLRTFRHMEELVQEVRREQLLEELPEPRRRSREEVLAVMERASARMRGVDADAALERYRDDLDG